MREGSGRRGLLRLFLISILGAFLLSGCGGTARYQPMELDAAESGSGNENENTEEEMPVITMGETEAAKAVPTDPSDGTEETAAADNVEETSKYQPVDETVVVTADLLNVRKEDRTDARIYVQLKTGEKLRRTGYNEEWSQVEYDGQTAYVASDMVEVYVEETAPESGAAAAETETGAAEPEPASLGETFAPGENGSPEAAPQARAAVAAAAGEDQSEIPWNGRTVAIDAGHQAKANAEKEPIGPGSETLKAKMPQGGVGASSGVKEYELALTLARKLEKELKARGYRTVMIRTSHDVNLANSERAAIANESGADIFLRIHANSMENSSVYGALGMCMTAQNPYNAELHDQSYRLAKLVIDHICAQTGTKNRGVQEVDNSGEINWSKIPVAVVETGFLSNPDEDRQLQDEAYQDRLVAGIAAAVDAYFAGP